MTKEKVIPQIRFSGFTDTWEQRKLDDIAKIKTPRIPIIFFMFTIINHVITYTKAIIIFP